MPHAPGGEHRGDLLDGHRDRDRVRQGGGVQEVQAIKAHALERPLQLRHRVLLGPELPPQLVGDRDRVAVGADGAKQLAEQDLGVAGGQRGVPGLVVVAGVVEEIDAGLQRVVEHPFRVPAIHALEGAPGAQRDPRDLQGRAAQPVVRHALTHASGRGGAPATGEGNEGSREPMRLPR